MNLKFKKKLKIVILLLLYVFTSCNVSEEKSIYNKINVIDFHFDEGMLINYDNFKRDSKFTEIFIPFQFKIINNCGSDIYKNTIFLDFSINKLNNTNDFIQVGNMNKEIILTNQNKNKIYFFDHLNPFKNKDTIFCFGYFSFPIPTKNNESYISFIKNPLNYFTNNIPCEPIISIKLGLDEIYYIKGENIKNELLKKYIKIINEKITNIDNIFEREKLLIQFYNIRT